MKKGASVAIPAAAVNSVDSGLDVPIVAFAAMRIPALDAAPSSERSTGSAAFLRNARCSDLLG
jgi:hypothetical protein